MISKIQKAIEIFNHIRNIPYHISTNGEAGSDCEDKAKMLISEFATIGISARMRIGFFAWSESGLPKEVLDVQHDPDCSHMFVEAEIDGRWVKLDPTWNPEMAKAGFPVADWDGKSDTPLAFPCNDFLPAEKSGEYLAKIDREKDIRDNGAFYDAINKYCDRFLS